MQICPSVLESTVDALVATINRLSLFYNYFQIDIGDGIFVNNRTVQIDDIAKNFKRFHKYQSLIFDFHLMVADFESDIKKINQLKKLINIKYIFIHYSAIENPRSFARLQFAQDDKGGNIGITLNPEDKVRDLISHYNLKKIPFIQIMSVTPGVQGNPFLPETLNKIEQLRLLGYRKEIFLDGAVNEKTIPVILTKKFKPDYICPGSFLTKAVGKELEKRVKYLSKLT